MEYLKYDLDRYFYMLNTTNFFSKIKVIFLTQGIWALIVYRFGASLRSSEFHFVIKKPLMLVMTVLQKLVEVTTGISIPFSAEIGRGLYIGHFGGIILNGAVVMGENCNLSQGVTIGVGGRGDFAGVPKIGDRVYLGPNTVVIGKIEIGDDVAVGANSVVTKSVPAGAVVAGVPAKIINMNGSHEFVLFRG